MNDKIKSDLKMDDLPEAVIVRHNRIKSLIIWIVPLIAIGIGIWLIITAFLGKGIPITITFSSAEGIDTNTAIKYEGISVGDVTSVNLAPDLDGVIVKAKLKRSAEKLARSGSKFWLVHPQIGAGGISGLETIITGNYIAVRPGKGAPGKFFEGLEHPPYSDYPGLKIMLKSTVLGSLSPGAPVYYREVKVGIVEHCVLANDAQHVNISLNIYEEFAPLVRENSQFWNASGIGMTLSLFGAKIKSESLAAILTGGIAFATPNIKQMGAPVQDGAVFTLYSNPENEWLKWQPIINLRGTEKEATAIEQQKEFDTNKLETKNQ